MELVHCWMCEMDLLGLSNLWNRFLFLRSSQLPRQSSSPSLSLIHNDMTAWGQREEQRVLLADDVPLHHPPIECLLPTECLQYPQNLRPCLALPGSRFPPPGPGPGPAPCPGGWRLSACEIAACS